jgi:hypothetical protein
VFVTELHAPGVRRSDAEAARWELFVFGEVRDVLASRRPDTLLVVHEGRERRGEWREALAAAGLVSSRDDARPPGDAPAA